MTKSYEGVWIDAKCRVSAYGKTKNELTKSKWDCKQIVRPTRCVEIIDSIAGLKDHYRLKGTSYLGKGQEVDLSLRMSRCDGYGYRVVEWRYI